MMRSSFLWSWEYYISQFQIQQIHLQFGQEQIEGKAAEVRKIVDFGKLVQF